MTDDTPAPAPASVVISPRLAIALIVLGAIAGVASGFLGIGGGVVLVGALQMLRVPIRIAIACSLAVVLPISIVGAVAHTLHAPEAVDWRVVAVLSIGMIAGARIGIELRKRLPDFWLKKLFAVLLIVAALRIFLGTPTAGEALVTAWWPLVLAGIFAGTASSLFGIGGGVIIVPVLMLGWGVGMKGGVDQAAAAALVDGTIGDPLSANISPTAGAVPISLCAMVVAAAAGAIFQRKLKQVHWPMVGLLAATGTISAVAGAVALGGANAGDAKLVFASVLCLVALRALIEPRVGKAPEEPPEPQQPPTTPPPPASSTEPTKPSS